MLHAVPGVFAADGNHSSNRRRSLERTPARSPERDCHKAGEITFPDGAPEFRFEGCVGCGCDAMTLDGSSGLGRSWVNLPSDNRCYDARILACCGGAAAFSTISNSPISSMRLSYVR